MALILQKLVVQQNFQLPNPPKVWVSGPPCVDGNREFVSDIEKKWLMAGLKWKNGSNSAKTGHTAKFPITEPP